MMKILVFIVLAIYTIYNPIYSQNSNKKKDSFEKKILKIRPKKNKKISKEIFVLDKKDSLKNIIIINNDSIKVLDRCVDQNNSGDEGNENGSSLKQFLDWGGSSFIIFLVGIIGTYIVTIKTLKHNRIQTKELISAEKERLKIMLDSNRIDTNLKIKAEREKFDDTLKSKENEVIKKESTKAVDNLLNNIFLELFNLFSLCENFIEKDIPTNTEEVKKYYKDINIIKNKHFELIIYLSDLNKFENKISKDVSKKLETFINNVENSNRITTDYKKIKNELIDIIKELMEIRWEIINKKM